jgi:hypothetical protein
MSTDFVPDNNIAFSEVKTFDHNGVTVHSIDEDGNIILTDSVNFLWAYPGTEIGTYKKGSNNNLELISHNHYEGVIFTQYWGNDPIRIIEAIEDFFNIRLISEYEDEYGDIVLTVR